MSGATRASNARETPDGEDTAVTEDTDTNTDEPRARADDTDEPPLTRKPRRQPSPSIEPDRPGLPYTARSLDF